MGPSGGIVHTMYNLPLGAQANTFKPQTSMSTTPASQVQYVSNPGAQTSVFRSQMSTTPTSHMQPPVNPGAQKKVFGSQMSMPMPQSADQAGTPQVMRQMESLISPTEDAMSAAGPNQTPMPHQSETYAAQMSAMSPGTQHDGFLTPEMPGRYFFA